MTHSCVDLTGQVSIVTGAGRGIGRAIAIALAAHGSDVVLFDISGADGEGTLNMLQPYGRKASFFAVDVTSEEQVQECVSQVLAEHGQIDNLINNVGVSSNLAFGDISLAEFQRILNINLTSYFIMCKAVVPAMHARKRGRIVMMSSGSAITGSGGGVHYAASKGGVNSLVRALARELAPSGILVNGVAPRTIATEALRELYPQEALKARLQQIPVGRLGTPDDVAHVTLFLLSDLSAFICGEILLVDGGRTYCS